MFAIYSGTTLIPSLEILFILEANDLSPARHVAVNFTAHRILAFRNNFRFVN